MAATILVVENHEVLRQSLCVWLEFTFPKCRIIGTGEEKNAAALARANLPDIVIVDTYPINGNAFEPVKELSATVPHSSIIVLADYDDAVHRAHAMNSGASAFVFKRAILAQLQQTVSAILNQHNGENKS